jgi:hypothetical protein
MQEFIKIEHVKFLINIKIFFEIYFLKKIILF